MYEDPWTGKSWDLSRTETQEAARRLLRKTRPKLLIVSPPCTLFSQLLNISGGPKDPVKFAEAVRLVEFAVDMCMEQRKAGRKYIFEHPAGATSWRLPCLQELREQEDARSVVFNMCRFGMKLCDKQGLGLVYKPTRVVTNSVAIEEGLERKCTRDHRHVRLESGRAALAAKYPQELSDAFIDGLITEDMRAQDVATVMYNISEYPDMCDPGEEKDIQESMQGIDDVTGEEIEPALIRAARKEEMQGFVEFEVYEYVLRTVAEQDKEGKFIGTRWVDHNKGSKESPQVRSRLVGQEFAKGEARDDLFAATPPLTATRLLLSHLASRGRGGPGDQRILLLDVKKAFLYGYIKRSVYIELPSEDPKAKGGKYVGKLRKAMYGTRDAPQVWQAEVKETMIELGFEPLISTPCVYKNSKTGVRVVAHVDDFMCTGPKNELNKLQKDLEKKYKMTGQMIGPGAGEEREGKFLGRTITWGKDGLEWKGDLKLRECLLKDWDMQNSSSVTTPGTKDEAAKTGMDIELTDRKRIARYRRAAAQINYIALDNPKVSFASKEVSRGMAKPTEEDEKKVKRVIRYLKGEPGVQYVYRWQGHQRVLSGYGDSDWAGCVKTRRSTSGGYVALGSHLLAHWARTQIGVALSSGEAELNSALKLGCEAIGIQVMASELEINLNIEMYGDSSAAKGTLARQGSGKIKHLSTKQLWLQEKVTSGDIKYHKIPRAKNASDVLTHHWVGPEGSRHFRRRGVEPVAT